MSKTNLVMLGTLALVLVSVAGRADTRTIPLSPDEHWWGLGAAWSDKMPITLLAAKRLRLKAISRVRPVGTPFLPG